MKVTLTGDTRFRVYKDKLVLQVKEQFFKPVNWGGCIEVEDYYRWRDARVEDLTVDFLKGSDVAT